MTESAKGFPGEELQQEIRKRLVEMGEEEYKKFTCKLMPGTDPNRVIGVRIPQIRKIAKEVNKKDPKEVLGYLAVLNSDCWHEEKLLWGILIGTMKIEDSERMDLYRRFVPVIDNWAVCDIACGKMPEIKKNPERWWDFLQGYLKHSEEYQIRFGVVMMLAHFIDGDHIDALLLELSRINHTAYYVTMAVGWTLSVCYADFPNQTEILLRGGTLSDSVQNKTIQKICESNRISKDAKERMKGLKRI